MQHLETAIRARAYALWVESGHGHGQDEQHWQQAEREIVEADVQPVAVEMLTTASVQSPPAKPVKKAAKAASPEPAAAAPAFVRKARAPRQTAPAAPLN